MVFKSLVFRFMTSVSSLVSSVRTLDVRGALGRDTGTIRKKLLRPLKVSLTVVDYADI